MDSSKETTNDLLKIGDRIKSLRESKGLTQKELAGDSVSRNMLSMIESGKALPSIETLVYISNALSVPVGYFFADEDELFLYGKKDAVRSYHRCIAANDLEGAIDISARYRQNDSEMRYYLCLAYMKAAQAKLDANMLTSASSYLDKAADIATDLTYGGDRIISLCGYVSTLIDTVSTDTVPEILINPDRLADIPIPAYFAAYLTAYKCITNGDLESASAIARSGMLHSMHSLHIKGVVSMRSGYLEAAANLLDIALSSEGGGFYSKYKLLCDLEICRKDLGDYEMAYSLSTSRMEMLGMFSK